jgi:F-type H+-transporting ATPase subunit delta
MNDSKISVRYSRALFQTAVEKDLLDKVYQDMLFISELCRMEEVKEVLKSPIIVPSKKRSVLLSVLNKNVQPVTISLVDLLIKNGRENYLPAVARVFKDETLKHRGITESTLTTAVPVNEGIKKEVKDLISTLFKTKVELKETVDSEIIGGFILKVNDNYIDASVKSKLRRIRKSLSVRTGSKEI